MDPMKRILVGEFYQETDTFNTEPMGLEGFTALRVAEGKEILSACEDLPCSFRGICDAITDNGGEVIPSVSLFSSAGGRVKDEVFEFTKERLRHYIETAGRIDAVFLSLHGATCTESEDDACGTLVEFVRGLVGDEMIIAASFDLHANITDALLKNLDIICGYHTYPHIDIYEAGYRAGKLGMARLNGEALFQASVHVPMIVPPAGYSDVEEPFRSVVAYAKQTVSDGRILDYSIFNVQPWLDVKEIASTVVTIAPDKEEALRCAAEIAERFFAERDGYWPELYSVDEIIDIAEANTSGKCVVLVDSADSANGGAMGDCIYPVARVVERGSSLRAAIYVRDPEAVKQAFETGVGNTAEFTVGNRLTPGLPAPLRISAVVASLHEGIFVPQGTQDRGTLCNIGKTAVLRAGNIVIIACCDNPVSTGDPQILRHFGVEPTLYDLLVVKANTSFKEPYSQFTDLIYYADSYGASSANLKSLQWEHIPAGLYPFDLSEKIVPEKAVLRRSL